MCRLLKNAPADFLNEDEFINSRSVEHALDACSIKDSLTSATCLISLLDSDLGRFYVCESSENINRLVAAHLIEVTDVSFGEDKLKWGKWLEERGQQPK